MASSDIGLISMTAAGGLSSRPRPVTAIGPTSSFGSSQPSVLTGKQLSEEDEEASSFEVGGGNADRLVAYNPAIPIESFDLVITDECHRSPISTISSPATDPGGATSARRASDFVDSRSRRCSRDKVNLDIFWLEDDALDDPDLLPPPDEVAAEIVESLETALASFRRVSRALSR